MSVQRIALGVGPTLGPCPQPYAAKPCFFRNRRSRAVDKSGELRPGMTSTGWPTPRAASRGNSGGRRYAFISEPNSFMPVNSDTGEPDDGHTT